MHTAIQIERARENMPFFQELLLWALEWIIIIGAILLVRTVWKNMINK